MHNRIKGIYMRQDIVSHIGTVTKVTEESVSASFNKGEACGNCHAKAICEGGKGQLITVEVARKEGSDFKPGQKVNVSLSAKAASKSVMLAYVYPLILLFAVMAAVIFTTGNQDAGCLAALATLPVYYTLLYMFRKRVNKKIEFAITEI